MTVPLDYLNLDLMNYWAVYLFFCFGHVLSRTWARTATGHRGVWCLCVCAHNYALMLWRSLLRLITVETWWSLLQCRGTRKEQQKWFSHLIFHFSSWPSRATVTFSEFICQDDVIYMNPQEQKAFNLFVAKEWRVNMNIIARSAWSIMSQLLHGWSHQYGSPLDANINSWQ